MSKKIIQNLANKIKEYFEIVREYFLTDLDKVWKIGIEILFRQG